MQTSLDTAANLAPNLSNLYWIDTNQQLLTLCDSILQSAQQGIAKVALDTEFVRTDSFFPLPGLYQVGFGDCIYLIDPLALDDWQPEAIQAQLNRTAESLEVGFGKVGQPLRVAVTGQGASPSLDSTLALIGKSRTLARLERALAFIEAREAASGD